MITHDTTTWQRIEIMWVLCDGAFHSFQTIVLQSIELSRYHD
jgi:hypothetical protein